MSTGAANARYFASLRAQGLCHRCRVPSGKTYCPSCSELKRLERERLRAKKRAAAGTMCVECGERERYPHRQICAGCRAKGYRARYALTAHGDGVQKCNTCGQAGHSARTCRSAEPARCRCGLSLPCNSCLPTAAELGSARLPWT